MEIQLTEELSTEMYKHFSSYHDIIIKVNEVAYSRIHQYYNTYVLAKKYWLKPMSEEKFFRKMAKGSDYIRAMKDGYLIITASNPRTVTIDTKSHLKRGVSFESSDVDLFYASIDCPILGWATEPEKVKKIVNLMDNYLSVPYKVDSEIIELYEKIKEKNFNRISVLKRCGVDYDF